jgi:ABC-type Fe3+-siderophore transport system permease subunit
MSSSTRTSAFDIRLIIAVLAGVYGLVLTVLGLFFMTDDEIAKSAGVNINLWTGIGLLVVALLFVLWARLRPLRVPEEHGEEIDSATPH